MGIITNLIILVFLQTSFAQAQTCQRILSKKRNGLRFASFNLESFSIKTSGDEVKNTAFKPRHQVNGIKKVFNLVDPDILLATEVVKKRSLKYFLKHELKGKYKAKTVRTNTGFSISLIYKASLNISVEAISHKHLKTANPVSGLTESAFVQDLPFFFIRDKLSGKHLMTLVGTHFKSERDRELDKKSFLKRTQEADLAVELIRNLKEESPEVPVIVMGDFNTNRKGTELNGFNNDLGFVDPFVRDFIDPHDMGQRTHSFHPDDGQAFYSSPDRAFVDPLIADLVIQSRVHRYRDRNGLIRPMPKTMKERLKNPSDHFPIYFDINL